MPTNPVKFGTDGWRALIARDFTFDNVAACAAATAAHFAQARGTGQPLIVGYDTRFLSDEFALLAARVLGGAGFAVQLADRPAPTPALSYRIVEMGAAGGLIVTSSHNPYNWNGIKVKPHYGGSASPEIVADIEERVPAILRRRGGPRLAPGDSDAIQRFNPLPGYLKALGERVDVGRIRAAGLRVALDPMYGTGAGLLAELIGSGNTSVTEIHTEPNPRFPGIRAPEPIESNLGEFLLLMAGNRFDIGIANDGDADRVGLVDENGLFVDQLRTFALLVEYLLGECGERGAVVKSITTTDMARLLAEHYGVPCIDTPVGFKHIGPVMMREDALIGGEESGGYGFRGHLPERDGLLAGLLLLDFVATTGRPPSTLVERVFALTGPHYYERVDIQLEPGQGADVAARLDAAIPDELAGRKVQARDTRDGWRYVLEEGWLLFRLSGTEPLLRIYTEVREQPLVKSLLQEGRALAGVPA